MAETPHRLAGLSAPDRARATGSPARAEGLARAGEARAAAPPPVAAVALPAQPVADVVPIAAAAPPPEPVAPFDPHLELAGLDHSGSLSRKAVRLAVADVARDALACFQRSGAMSGAPRKARSQVRLTIEEDGRARGVEVTGSPAALVRCVQETAALVRSRTRPDTGTVAVSFNLEWTQ